MHTGSLEVPQSEWNPGIVTGPLWQYLCPKTTMEICRDYYVNLKALFTLISYMWYSYIYLYLDKILALLSQRLDCWAFCSSFSIPCVHLLDSVHKSPKELATLCLTGDSWSLQLSDLSLILSIPNILSLWWNIKELLLHTWCFLWHCSPLKKTILIKLWKISNPKSKTVHPKHRKSQGTSEAQGPTLAYITIIKFQELL